MKEFVISEVKAETAILVGLITQEQDEAKTKEYLDELEFLADTAGAVTVKRFTQRVGGPNMTTYVGKGKLEEIKEYIKEKEDEKLLLYKNISERELYEIRKRIGIVFQNTGEQFFSATVLEELEYNIMKRYKIKKWSI